MPSQLTSFAQNTKTQSAQVNANFSNLSDRIRPTFVFILDQALTVGLNQTPIVVCTNNLTIEKVYAAIKTPSTGATIICDINVNGTSIWAGNQANRITIPIGSGYATASVFDTTTLSDGDQLTLDIDQVGSLTPGTTLTIEIKTS